MRIGIVNDRDMAIEAIRRTIGAHTSHQVIWLAHNGLEAVRCASREKPDLILMDLFMPVMDGIEATRQIMKLCPCPILIVTGSVDSHSTQVFEALGAGALDVVATPDVIANGSGTISSLVRKLNVMALVTQGGSPVESNHSPKTDPQKESKGRFCRNLIAIGASAGGPAAILEILLTLPKSLNAGIVIVQHVDSQFAEGLAHWLESKSSWPVRLVEPGDRPERGQVLLTGGDDHLIMLHDGCLGFTSDPIECVYRPSIDCFFQSLVRQWKGELIALLLTGMGRDGAKGLKALRENGTLTLAQNQATSAVYGMPKYAAELGAASKILPLSGMASEINKAFRHEQ